MPLPAQRPSTNTTPQHVPGHHFTPAHARAPVNYPSGGGAPVPPSSPSYPTQYGYPSPSIAPPDSSGGGGGGGGNGGGGGGGGGKDKAPSVHKYLLQDDQYQTDRESLIKNFRNLRASNREDRGNVKEDKGLTLGRLNQDRKDQLEAMIADFAARGQYGGAEYLDELNDFNRGFSEQRSDTVESADRNITQLLRDLHNAKTLKTENIEQARLEAIRRRAAEYGLKHGNP